MIEVEMSEDIRKYEPKAIGPFTLRQAICAGIAVCLGLPAALIIPGDITVKVLIFCLFGGIPLACGYIKMDGAYAEVIVIRYIYSHMLTPRKRKYKRKNAFKEQIEILEKKEENAKLSQMTSSQQKSYQKQKAKKGTVKYSNKKEYRVYR